MCLNDGYFGSRFTADKRRTLLWKTLCAAYFQKLIGESDTVLELGAGYCDFINHVQARQRLAIDIWPGLVSSAAEGVEAHVGELDDLDWIDDSSVDSAFASNVFSNPPTGIATASTSMTIHT